MEMEYNFALLTGIDTKGKTKTWEIHVINQGDYSEIKIRYGYEKKIETTTRISEGKNLGKKNETSHFQQAISEAQSKWNKKRDHEGYSEVAAQGKETNAATEVAVQKEIETENPLPMLAHDYKKQKTKVKYPCFLQMKLDGMRMVYNTTTGKITTRQGNDYDIIKESGKLYEELKKLPKGLILDGELYTDKLNFENLGIVRKTKNLSEKDRVNLCKIEYHIYDLIDTKLTFEQRNKIIKELLYKDTKKNYEKLIYVETFLAKNEEEIKNYHTKFLEDGYEGTMIRNKDSFYKIKHRSNDLLKYKDFQDAEFKIIDFTVEKDTSGADENLIVWIIGIPVDHAEIKCKVRPQGTREERKDLYKKCVNNFEEFRGRKLWTKFFEYTADGSLRFPSTMRNTFTEYIRDELI